MASKDQRQQLYALFSQLGNLGDISSEYSSPGYVDYIKSVRGGINDYGQYSSSPYHTRPLVPQSLVDMFGDKVSFSPIYGMTMPTGDYDPTPDYNTITGYSALVDDVGALYDAQGNLQKTYRKEGDSGLMKLMRTAMPALALGVMGGAAFAPEALGSIGAGSAGTTGGAAAGGAAPAAAGPGYFGGLSSTPAAAVSGMGGGAGLNIGAAGPLAAGSAMMPTLGAAGTAALAAGGGAAAPAATGGGLSGLLRSILGGGGDDGEGGSGLGLLASLINAYSQNRQGSAQEDWADRLYQDRSQFLERLARTYSNPEEYLSGPEYTAAAGITLDQLQRKDAARGRLATDVERQKLMQDYALQSLGNYRSGLATAAGLSPTQGLADLSVTGQANKYGTFNAPISELARILEGNNSFDFDDLLDDIIGGWF